MNPTHHPYHVDAGTLARLRRRMAGPRQQIPAQAAPARAPSLLKLLAISTLSRSDAISAMDGDRTATAAAFDWLRAQGYLEQCGGSLAHQLFRARPGANLQAPPCK